MNNMTKKQEIEYLLDVLYKYLRSICTKPKDALLEVERVRKIIYD